MNFSIFTLGCKLNQLESEAIADSFRKAGFRLVPWDARSENPRIIIVNTCTVTSKADQKARRMIRKLLKDNPESPVIVTGCYAQLDAVEIEALEEQNFTTELHGVTRSFDTKIFSPSVSSVSSVVNYSSLTAHRKRLFVIGGGKGGATKTTLLSLPEYLSNAIEKDENLSGVIARFFESAVHSDSVFDFKPEDFSFHSRGYLKIQDGCDNNCAYCRVRLARGHSVSLNHDAVLERLRAFEEKGCAELFITGVNITQYRDNDIDLAGLLQLLLDGTGKIFLRLSSLEPERIDEKLASVLAHPRIRPHFHVSAQSGSDAILKSMNRMYDSRALEKAITLLRSVKDNPFIACDIITGFPGETEEEFARTLAFCEKINFAWIHAFPYSKRPGTAAFSFGDPVRDSDKTRRMEILGETALRGKREYAKAWIGKELSAVVENTPCATNQCRAVSENYLKLLVNCNGEPPSPGSVIRCTPVSLSEDENIDAMADEE